MPVKKSLVSKWMPVFARHKSLHRSLPLSFFISTFCLSANADLLIDGFVTPQSTPGTTDTRNTADGSDILGGERDIISYLLLSVNGTVPNQLRVSYPTPSS